MARLRKATFSLPSELLAGLDAAVKSGEASSKNSLVERALGRELRELRRSARRRAWEAASRDPAFLKDLEEVDAEFAAADAESAATLR